MKILLPIIKIAGIFLRYNTSDFPFLLSSVYSNFSLSSLLSILYPLLLFIMSNPPPPQSLSPLLPPVESVFHNSAYIYLSPATARHCSRAKHTKLSLVMPFFFFLLANIHSSWVLAKTFHKSFLYPRNLGPCLGLCLLVFNARQQI